MTACQALWDFFFLSINQKPASELPRAGAEARRGQLDACLSNCLAFPSWFIARWLLQLLPSHLHSRWVDQEEENEENKTKKRRKNEWFWDGVGGAGVGVEMALLACGWVQSAYETHREDVTDIRGGHASGAWGTVTKEWTNGSLQGCAPVPPYTSSFCCPCEMPAHLVLHGLGAWHTPFAFAVTYWEHPLY